MNLNDKHKLFKITYEKHKEFDQLEEEYRTGTTKWLDYTKNKMDKAEAQFLQMTFVLTMFGFYDEYVKWEEEKNADGKGFD